MSLALYRCIYAGDNKNKYLFVNLFSVLNFTSISTFCGCVVRHVLFLTQLVLFTVVRTLVVNKQNNK